MLPTEWCHVLEQAECDRGAAASERVDGTLKIPRVPKNDGGYQQVQPGRAVSLVFE